MSPRKWVSRGNVRPSGSTDSAATVSSVCWIGAPRIGHPTAIGAGVAALIEVLRRTRKWSARRITLELAAEGSRISVLTVGQHLARLGLNRRRFLDPGGEVNRSPQRIIARRPGYMVHVDIKKVGHIPDGGG